MGKKKSSKFQVMEDYNLGSIPEFKFGDDWNKHREYLEDYFNFKCCYDNIRKISILIATLDQETYVMMRDFCNPELPHNKTFNQLCEMMEKDYIESLIFCRRREFHNLQQLFSETISQWFIRVTEVAAQCDFGKYLDDRIKDQFVTGMKAGKILDRILKVGYKISLKNIVEIALKKENELRSFERLPKKILFNIFSYLSISDRIRIQRVNKLCQEMIKKSWNNQKELRLNSQTLGRKWYPFDVPNTIVELILRQCGRHLEKIHIEYTNRFECALPIIANYCPNIQFLTVNRVSIIGLQKLSEICRNITELNITCKLDEAFDKVLGDLFSNNKKLQVLDFQGYEGNGDCLTKLPFEKIIAIKIQYLSLKLLENEHKVIKMIEKSKNLSIFKYETADANVLTALAKSCSNLTELDICFDICYYQFIKSETDDDIDNKLSQIFKSNKKLKSIKLHGFYTMTGACFLSLDENVIEEIAISGASNIQADFLINSLPNFKKLHTLEFKNFSSDAFTKLEHMAECISLCSKLKKLNIYDNKIHEDLNLFASSKNIAWLTISVNSDKIITESFLNYISCNLIQLKYLDISANIYQITNLNFDLNVEFKNLEVLNISRHVRITGLGLRKFTNLKELYCEGCENLQDIHLASLLRCAANLRILNIRGCKKITNEIIDLAIELTRKRINNILLKIQVKSTKIKTAKIEEESHLLHLE